MSDRTIVIVGGGQAGGWAAQTLRNDGFEGRIVLIGDEPHRPYERPPLSKAVLAGDAHPDTTSLQKPEAFDALRLDWRPGVSATRIDRTAKQLPLSRGEPIRYDSLILCTGGRARRLAIPGSDLPGVFTLRSIGDAGALGAALVPGKRLLVVGGGWIGLEVAATARKKGLNVTVVEAMGRLCERTVPAEISSYLLRLHTAHGVQVELGAGIEQLAQGPGEELTATLSDGRRLACDVVLFGVGLIANDELAREAGLACEGGVWVDAQCRTSDPDILAAGDVAVWHCDWAARRMRLESWQNAQAQGIAAARAALGTAVNHQPLPWFWSDQYDVKLQIAGFNLGYDATLLRPGSREGSASVWYFREGKLIAVDAINDAKAYVSGKKMIENGITPDKALLADPATDLKQFIV